MPAEPPKPTPLPLPSPRPTGAAEGMELGLLQPEAPYVAAAVAAAALGIDDELQNEVARRAALRRSCGGQLASGPRVSQPPCSPHNSKNPARGPAPRVRASTASLRRLGFPSTLHSPSRFTPRGQEAPAAEARAAAVKDAPREAPRSSALLRAMQGDEHDRALRRAVDRTDRGQPERLLDKDAHPSGEASTAGALWTGRGLDSYRRHARLAALERARADAAEAREEAALAAAREEAARAAQDRQAFGRERIAAAQALAEAEAARQAALAEGADAVAAAEAAASAEAASATAVVAELGAALRRQCARAEEAEAARAAAEEREAAAKAAAAAAQEELASTRRHSTALADALASLMSSMGETLEVSHRDALAAKAVALKLEAAQERARKRGQALLQGVWRERAAETQPRPGGYGAAAQQRLQHAAAGRLPGRLLGAVRPASAGGAGVGGPGPPGSSCRAQAETGGKQKAPPATSVAVATAVALVGAAREVADAKLEAAAAALIRPRLELRRPKSASERRRPTDTLF